MSVKIRLSKTGRKNQISWRVVAQDTRSKRDGKFLQILGYYNPSTIPAVKIDEAKYQNWLQKGAIPTPAVTKLRNAKVQAAGETKS